MLKLLAIAVFLALAAPAAAQTSYDRSWRPFETTDESRQRHDSERYFDNQRRGYEPFGGRSERFGDPAPYGTRSPGLVAPKGEDWRGGSYRERSRRRY